MLFCNCAIFKDKFIVSGNWPKSHVTTFSWIKDNIIIINHVCRFVQIYLRTEWLSVWVFLKRIKCSAIYIIYLMAKKKMPLVYILNKTGPRIDPWETPEKNFSVD